ncbi:MAG: hypothetical protein FE046_01990 [Thermoplasmata archaeon]|nr:MAG: hypothetical protein FE046_01990 [Thermoplasmata archaeon]
MKDKLKGLLFNSKIRGYTNKNLAKYTLYGSYRVQVCSAIAPQTSHNLKTLDNILLGERRQRYG